LTPLPQTPRARRVIWGHMLFYSQTMTLVKRFFLSAKGKIDLHPPVRKCGFFGKNYSPETELKIVIKMKTATSLLPFFCP
jgi:hypothetical protein